MKIETEYSIGDDVYYIYPSNDNLYEFIIGLTIIEEISITNKGIAYYCEGYDIPVEIDYIYKVEDYNNLGNIIKSRFQKINEKEDE